LSGSFDVRRLQKKSVAINFQLPPSTFSVELLKRGDTAIQSNLRLQTDQLHTHALGEIFGRAVNSHTREISSNGIHGEKNVVVTTQPRYCNALSHRNLRAAPE
jgi:hypothetical protein